MRLSIATLALGLAPWAAPAPDGGAAALLASVRAGLKGGGSDAGIAATVRRTRLTERLDEAVIEELQSEGAGPETLEELDRQREITRALAPPAQALKLFDAPPAASAEEQSTVVEKARANALQYNAGLPNFLCSETIRRSEGAARLESWKPRDTLKFDVGYSDKGERYKLIEINGQPTTRSLRSVGGFYSTGEFGSLLQWIFAPESRTAFRWERWTNLRGRPAQVFSYRIQQERSRYEINWRTAFRNYQMVSAFRGVVYIDRETHQVLRFTHEAEGIPADWPIVRTSGMVDYGFADVGGQRFLLPRRVDSRVVMKSGQRRNVVEFGNYRKFSSEATVTFDK